ncbi:ABC transporter permease [Paraflavitalea speifideaquila]|uniref:ABC transporter permease n=1 Tax=Paraflavitalea speifideaquila TaxID=3076558 RepID=UPI0028EE8C8F|nr:ABC transporter permease [Paraflavitalea speifideiaquila]
MQPSDFDYGANVFVIGYEVAVNLFGNADKAVGQLVKMKEGKRGLVVGLIKKQGKSIVGGWEYDNSILMPLGFMRTMVREKTAVPSSWCKARKPYPWHN